MSEDSADHIDSEQRARSQKEEPTRERKGSKKGEPRESEDSIQKRDEDIDRHKENETLESFENRFSDVERRLSDVEEKYNSAVSMVKKLDSKMEEVQEDIASQQSNVGKVEEEIADITARLDKVTTELKQIASQEQKTGEKIKREKQARKELEGTTNRLKKGIEETVSKDEFTAFQRRIEEEIEEARRYSHTEFFEEVIRAKETLRQDQGTESVDETVDFVAKQLEEALARSEVSKITTGEEFDRRKHKAIEKVEITQSVREYRHNEIVEIYSEGYRIGDRILRPAHVKVAIDRDQK